MSMQRTPLWLAISAIGMLATSVSYADTQNTATVHQLPTLIVSAHPLAPSEQNITSSVNIIHKEKLSQGAVTLGNAINGLLGVHTDNFGVGASRPVIRGQAAPRVKVLTDASEVMDASQISPDHVATVNPILSTKIEVLRGPSTLLYGGGAIGGVVNVLDEKIPTQIPHQGITGEAHLRGGSNANEKLAALALTAGVGQFALHVEADKREADNYQVSGYTHEGEREKRVDGTWTKGQNLTAGFSWIGEQGYLGLAYTDRHDKYALSGHSHEYHDCDVNEIPTPHLVGCGGHGGHHHDEESPWIDLKAKRWDLRGEYLQPFAGIEKIRLRAGYSDYHHHEIEDDEIATTFKNKAYDSRVEFIHRPLAGFKGVFGLQYNHSKFSALGEEAFLPITVTKNLSGFLVEQYQWKDFSFEAGARLDKQTITPEEVGYKKYDDHALSASIGSKWQLNPDYALTLSMAYSERMPNAQELYAYGAHLATNTLELGDENLTKEKSKNIELGLQKVNGDFTFALSTFYNKVDDYIYAHTLDRYENFRLIQYRQADATFYGGEAEVKYQFSPRYQGKIFADHVRAKLSNQKGNLPRIPETRLGVRFEADFLDGIHGGVEYVHGFKQNKIADYETITPAYNLVNLDVSYDKKLNTNLSYQVYLQAQNLFDETYYNHASYLSSIPQMGRNFTAGLRFRF